MSVAGPPGDKPDSSAGGREFSALLEDSAEDLYDHAPCGYLSTMLDGSIAKINETLLRWLGYTREELVGRRRFTDLLTVGGRMYHETHFAPLLRLRGELGGIALELKAADGTRLPVLVSSTVKTGSDGTAQLIRTTIFDARDRRSYEEELVRAREEAERARDHAQRLARTLQRTLLPPALPEVPGLAVAAHYHPASSDEVGGDFYDLFPLADGAWGFFLGDVSGKGAGAAVVTSLARYTLRAAAVHDPEPATALDRLNTALHQEYHGADPRFCTVLQGLLVPEGDGFALTLAAGGHPPALLISASERAVDVLDTRGGMLVGAIAGATFTTVRRHLRPGDTLLLYSDGLTEARTHGRVRYSEELLRDHVATLAPTTAPALVTALTDLLAGFGEGVDDDTALLALSVPLREGDRP
ncbi:SpoIIE family protein phosphatase [Amycolatopsis rhabdoformis]|uniref:SpoIIE family protein phosphatase n=1 Tax=Amycolatopsis rhabdoformis TaxID=1448059 RepID=A0ABZ1ID19_9PSEU|nr:SpoIIE family protein phosphatase [Amycolatopsis rhabdoformis]WSE32038.1 SpoIIE family protein phosphatase [Amycolatopsis rhabdoformis]